MGNLKRTVIGSVIIILLGLCISSAKAENHDFDFFTLFENHGAVMLLVEVESGAIVRANEAAVDFYGYPKAVLESMNIRQLNMLGQEEAELKRRIAAEEKRNYFISSHRLANGTMRTVEIYAYPFQLISKDGKEIAIADSAAPICDDSVNIHGVVLVFRDVTEEQANLRRIEYLSFHDQLTGLYNRHFFETELNRLDIPRNLPMSMVIADVNGLKLVNDAFGHKAGDELLKKAAEAISSQCRGDEIIARIGGDEFVILLPKTDLNETERIVKRIQKKTREIFVDTVMLSISMGWACKDTPEIKFSEVFKRAEKYMYHRKLFDSQSMRGATVHSIISVLHEKNKREEQHSRRVSVLNSKIGQAMGLNEESIEELRNMGMLHDIGKIAIAENILNKPENLTSEERNEIKRHPEIGYHILSSATRMAEIAQYILAHHERWDGNGYPKGLLENEIPLQARITAVANVYDSMVTERPYRKTFSKEEALEELKRNAGTQFDPEIVKIFVEKVAPQEEV